MWRNGMFASPTFFQVSTLSTLKSVQLLKSPFAVSRCNRVQGRFAMASCNLLWHLYQSLYFFLRVFRQVGVMQLIIFSKFGDSWRLTTWQTIENWSPCRKIAIIFFGQSFFREVERFDRTQFSCSRSILATFRF
jgi:hypothetical protein